MIKRIVSVLVLLGFAMGVYAQEEQYKPMDDPAEFKSMLKESITDISSIKSEFSQDKVLDIFEETIESKGVFYYQKEDKVRWEYTSPIKYIIILNGSNILLQSENSEKKYDLSSNKFMEVVNELMVGSIKGDILEKDGMFEKEYFVNDDFYIARLLPKDKKVEKVLKQIEMFFNKNDLSVDKLKFTEYTGDYTDIIFTTRPSMRRSQRKSLRSIRYIILVSCILHLVLFPLLINAQEASPDLNTFGYWPSENFNSLQSVAQMKILGKEFGGFIVIKNSRNIPSGSIILPNWD